MAEHNGRRAIHSGRIKATSIPAAGLKIVRDVPNSASFRIYNTGESLITIQPDMQAAIELQKKSSTDVSGSTEIEIAQSASPVEGIYERIDMLKGIRGGRFRGDASAGVVIAQNRGPVIYRILNSGQRTFTVNGTSLDTKLSIDVGAGTSIVLARGDANLIEAIYDFLPNENARSGRFKVTKKATEKHTIIDLSGQTIKAYYRILNSGEEDFQFRLSTSTTAGQRVKPEQSFDFAVSGGTIMTVSPMADDKRIQGIYEYLGQS